MDAYWMRALQRRMCIVKRIELTTILFSSFLVSDNICLCRMCMHYTILVKNRDCNSSVN